MEWLKGYLSFLRMFLSIETLKTTEDNPYIASYP